MKKLFGLLFCLFSVFAFAQNINQYEFFTVPTKFDFQGSENEYRLNSLLKFRLDQYGFKVSFTTNTLKTNYDERCLSLDAIVVNESTAFLTKYYIEFRDCNNIVIFKSDLGTSKSKDRKEGATEALENALLSVKALNYKFVGKKDQAVKINTNTDFPKEIQKTEISNANMLFAQPILNGFQLVDASPKVVFKIFKTSQADFFIANTDKNNGVIFMKNNQWFFEYYENDKLTSEKLTIKF